MSDVKERMRQGARRQRQRGLEHITAQAARAQAGHDDGVITVDLDRLTVDARIQVRVGGLDEARVAQYALAMEEGAEFPPSHVHRDGDVLYLAAGFHRLAAAMQAEDVDTLDVIVHPGGFEAALEYAEDDNLSHGLNLSSRDKRHIFERRFERGHEWVEWSNRRIAATLGVDEGTVRSWKKRLTAENSAVEEPARRVGVDGRSYDVSGIQAANEARQTPPPTPPRRQGGEMPSRGVSDETPDLEPLEPFPVGEEEFVPAEHTKLMLAAIRHTLFTYPDIDCVTVDAMCDRTDLTAAQVVQVCGELVERGLLEALGESKWRPVTPPPDPLPASREGEVEPPGVAGLLQELLGLTHALKNHLTEVAEGREVVPVEYRDGVADQMYDLIDYVNGVMHTGGKYERGVLDLIDAVFARWSEEGDADEA